MVKRLSEINKTAFFAWSPGQQTPLIAAGTAAGAFDDSFSNASELELFKLDIKNSSSNNIESVGKISCASRFNKLVWGYASTDKPYGIIAGGLDNNELCLWDPSKMMDGDNSNEAKMMSNSTHTGEIRGLDFNKFQNNLLASAGSNNEVYIWDLTNPNTPYTPGPKSQKLEDITSVGWNGQVQHILATSSATGHTVVWDLRNRKEVMTLSAPNMGGINASRRSISSVVWHPDVATQLVTASEDDSNPVVTLWDLRHAHSPEKVLAGHTKGVLGISWCRQDSDLLMSCGKDCKTLIWNPNSGELLGELTQDSNYTFQTEWCPRNPDLLASASFDGKISVYSLQNSESEDNKAKTAETVNEDPFSAALNASTASTSSSTFALRHPPKWLRCPVGASFGFGGKLVSFNNKANHLTKQAVANAPPGQASAPQIVSRTVQVNTIVTDKEMIQRSDELEAALEQQSVEQLVEERIQGAKEKDNKESWEVIKTLLAENAREQLMNYLGFQKAEIVAAVEKITANKKGLNEDKPKEEEKEEAAISPELTTESAEMEETEKDKVTSSDEAIKPDEPSEEKQDTEDVQEESGDKAEEPKLDETTTDNSASNLFGDDNGDNFFIQSDNTQAPVEENTDNRDTAAAVTKILGSAIKHEPLQLYSEGSSETDSLITRAVVLGDFESAVNLCLSTERFSDALLFAICGGGDLLARTQQAYFKHQSRTTSYLRLLESIIDEDLQSIVASVSLEEWTSVIVVLCTFAKAEDFKPLCEALGARLEEGWNNSETESAKEFRRHATLCYLAAGNIEKIARIWIAEQEEEVEKTESESIKTASLQDLIEKITIFRKVIAFEDPALFETNENKLPYEFPLAPLYDKYCEYAELLASQGKLTTALSYLSLTPIVYRKAAFDKLSIIRDRIYQACPVSVTSQYTQPAVPFEKQSIDAKVTEAQAQTQAQPQTQSFQQSYQPYQPTAVSANPPPPSVQPTYGAVRSPLVSNTYTPVVNNYTPATNTYTPAAPPASNYAPSTVPTSSTTYAPPTATGAPTTAYQPQTTPTNATSPSYGYNQPANNFNAGYNNVSSGYPPAANTYGGEQYSNSSYNATRTTIPPPPPPIGGVAPTPRSMSQESTSTPIKKAEGAWNDPPMNIASKKIRSPKIGSSPAKRVTSPFPNQPAAAAFVNPTQQSARMPPPPQGTIPPPPMSRGPPPPMGPPRGGMPPMQQQQQRPMAMGHQQPITQMAPPMGMAQAPPPRANPLPPPPMNAAAPVSLAKRGPPPQGGYYQQK
ncbi:uncharacterized protein BX663DRAFT_551537 [Cokeromyces recurvatus]|uniref:uncharacterized protein n=1 Tax=Cokeromyces recurvatus TaxID=90255 RepID=UPI00221FB8C0|nr:uncharacterized protein BX663DRAFT_551537 [Cokeromyces recurvatus]KAI7903232.1 hypothetical protein BX663DRAFT_551537 [Cokeromyces recurvatus]